MWNYLKKLYEEFMKHHSTFCYEHLSEGNDFPVWDRFLNYLNKIKEFIDIPELYEILDSSEGFLKIDDEKIMNIYEAHIQEILAMYNQILAKKSKILQYDLYHEVVLNSYGKSLVQYLYKYVKKEVRESIFYNSSKFNLSIVIEKYIDILPYKLDKHEKLTFIDEACNFYKKQFKPLLINEKLYKKYFNDKEKGKLINDLVEYIMNHLQQIFLKFNMEKDNNDMYVVSWIDTDGDLDSDKEKNYLYDFLLRNRFTLLRKIKYNKAISHEKWEDLVKDVIDKCDANYNIFVKIRDLVNAKNLGKKITRSNELLNNNDEVRYSTYINYDVTNDYVRTRPIIIIRDIKEIDHVFFGPLGTSHGDYVQNKLQADINSKGIQSDNYHMGYGYLLGNIAFVDEIGDELQIGFTLDEIINALKKDPRIKKIYTTPPNRYTGGIIKRLAKKYKNFRITKKIFYY